MSKKDKKAVKLEAKAVTAESAAMGEALKKAGFDPDAGALAPLTTYEVVISYEGLSGKRYTQTTHVSDCRNAQDAQKAVTDEIIKRGLNSEHLEFITTIERPELNKEVAMEASGELFPEPPAAEKPEDQPAHRIVRFSGKIVDMNVKQGDTRILKIGMVVGSDIARVNSELLDKFKSSEYLLITIEPMQLTDLDIKATSADPEEKTAGETQPTMTVDMTESAVEEAEFADNSVAREEAEK